ncbi:MAG: amidohydrolase family protein, partial [Fuerstiella sp.]|nr:amidohydrolase family protein [Fuerstiella sp.]
TLQQVVSWMCTAPARVWDIANKGSIQVGFDADLVLVDMNREAEIRNEQQVTKSGWSPWHGTRLKGWPVRTIVRGKTVYNDGVFDETVRGTEAKFDHRR